MIIREKKATVYECADGTIYPTRSEAVNHEFRLTVIKWVQANFYSGMDSIDLAAAMYEDRDKLARIFREFMI